MRKAIYLFFLLLNSCQKYEEGPWFSLYSAKNRIERKWKIEEYYVNDIDSSTSIVNNPCYMNLIFVSGEYYEFYGESNSISCSINGSWELKNNCKEIGIYLMPNSFFSSGPLSSKAVAIWEILRLTRNDFWIQTTYNNVKYKVKMQS